MTATVGGRFEAYCSRLTKVLKSHSPTGVSFYACGDFYGQEGERDGKETTVVGIRAGIYHPFPQRGSEGHAREHGLSLFQMIFQTVPAVWEIEMSRGAISRYRGVSEDLRFPWKMEAQGIVIPRMLPRLRL